MDLSCARRGSGWILEKKIFSEGVMQAAHGGGGGTVLGGVLGFYICVTEGLG